MAQTIFTLSPEMQQSWDYVMGQMLSFVNDTNADVDMAYDFVCEQLDIDSFVDNQKLWDDFYMYWESADNRNTMEYVAMWYKLVDGLQGVHQTPQNPPDRVFYRSGGESTPTHSKPSLIVSHA